MLYIFFYNLCKLVQWPMQVYFSVNCSKKGVLIHWNHFSGNVCCRYASVITVTYIVAFNPGIKMACAIEVVSFSYTLCPSRDFDGLAPFWSVSFRDLHSPLCSRSQQLPFTPCIQEKENPVHLLISMFFVSVGLFHFSSSTTALTQGLLHFSHGPLAPHPLRTEKEMLSPSVCWCWRVSCSN